MKLVREDALVTWQARGGITISGIKNLFAPLKVIYKISSPPLNLLQKMVRPPPLNKFGLNTSQIITVCSLTLPILHLSLFNTFSNVGRPKERCTTSGDLFAAFIVELVILS